MMTVITRVVLTEGDEPEWDAAMRERMAAAEDCTGWVAGQVLMPAESLNERVIIGVWQTRANWEAWHGDEAFVRTRERLDRLQSGIADMRWHEVLHDARR